MIDLGEEIRYKIQLSARDAITSKLIAVKHMTFSGYGMADDEMWNEFVKSGNFKGVSVEGMFDLVPYKETFEDQFLKILNQITQY